MVVDGGLDLPDHLRVDSNYDGGLNLEDLYCANACNKADDSNNCVRFHTNLFQLSRTSSQSKRRNRFAIDRSD